MQRFDIIIFIFQQDLREAFASHDPQADRDR